MELNDRLAEAHAALGHIKMHSYDWREAEAELKRAIQLNPSYLMAHHWLGICLASQGRLAQAIDEMKLAHNIEPVSLITNADLALVLFYSRKYDEAIEQLLKTLEMDSSFTPARTDLGIVYLKKSMLEEAITQFRDIKTAEDWLGYAYAKSGRKDEAQKILQEFNEQLKKGYVTPDSMALLYYGLGDLDKCFEWLVGAVEEHAVPIAIKVDPTYDDLRSDSRFASLLKKMGLE